MNDVDINQFQFEYDLTWMSFFQDGNGRTYARYGGRDDSDAESHLNKASLMLVMKQVLKLHETNSVQPVNKYEPESSAKRTALEMPAVKKMLARRESKCVHCHEVKAGLLIQLGEQGKLQKEMVYTYPSPGMLGLVVDPENPQRVKKVQKGSAADVAKLAAEDKIVTLDGQRVLTFADMTRVLELAPETGKLKVAFERAGKFENTEIELGAGWRVSPNPAWRESNHAVGPNSGFWAVEAGAKIRKKADVAEGNLALRVNVIWGKWARAAKIKQGDVIVSIDGRENRMTIKQLQTHLQLNRDWGDKVAIVVWRSGKRVELTMTLPDGHDR